MSDLVLPVPQTTFKNLMGMRFSHLVVAGYAGMSKNKRPRHLWRCRCDCGRDCIKSTQILRASASGEHNCGCVTHAQRVAAKKTHGLSHTREFRSWAAAKSRCNNPNGPEYAMYGGRGISFCQRWNRFERFYEDMGPMPEWASSIDRIDPNGNYEPGNCRWSTPLQQSRNTRRNVFITHDGKTLCLSEWAVVSGIKRPTIEARIRRGWAFAKAISEPPKEGCYVPHSKN